MKRWKWQHIAALILEIGGLVLLVLTMATELYDDLLLPLALGFIGAGNVLLLIENIRQYRRSRGTGTDGEN